MITDYHRTYDAPPPWYTLNEYLRDGDHPQHVQAAVENTRASVADAARVEAVYAAHYASAHVIAQARSVCEVAASVLRTPHAQVALVDARYQSQVTSYHRAEGRHRRGGNMDCTDGLCQFVVGLDAPLVISDAPGHALVRETKQVTQQGVVAYLGVPVEAANAHVIGSLCVWDELPRDWDVSDVDLLTRLSRMLTRADVMSQQLPAATT